jgi:hypothetical protein
LGCVSEVVNRRKLMDNDSLRQPSPLRHVEDFTTGHTTDDPTINKWLPNILAVGSSAEERYIDGSLVGIYIKFAEPIYPEVTQ